MTASSGIGMFIVGLFAIGIIAGIGYYVINKKEKKEKTRWDDLESKLSNLLLHPVSHNITNA